MLVVRFTHFTFTGEQRPLIYHLKRNVNILQVNVQFCQVQNVLSILCGCLTFMI